MILDDVPLIEAGFYKKVLDEKTLLERYQDGEYLPLIEKYTKVELINKDKPPKLKVNKRRATANNTALELQRVS